MAAQPQDTMSTRREDRSKSPFIGQLRRSSGIAQNVTIRDMSPGGLQATCFNAPSEGEMVSIRFENGRSVQGKVRWVRKGIFGVEFPGTIDVSSITDRLEPHPMRRSTDIH